MFKKFGAFYKIDNSKITVFNATPKSDPIPEPEQNTQFVHEILPATDASYRDYIIRHKRISAEIDRRKK